MVAGLSASWRDASAAEGGGHRHRMRWYVCGGSQRPCKTPTANPVDCCKQQWHVCCLPTITSNQSCQAVCQCICVFSISSFEREKPCWRPVGLFLSRQTMFDRPKPKTTALRVASTHPADARRTLAQLRPTWLLCCPLSRGWAFIEAVQVDVSSPNNPSQSGLHGVEGGLISTCLHPQGGCGCQQGSRTGKPRAAAAAGGLLCLESSRESRATLCLWL